MDSAGQLADDALAFLSRSLRAAQGFSPQPDFLSQDETNLCFKQFLNKPGNDYEKEKKNNKNPTLASLSFRASPLGRVKMICLRVHPVWAQTSAATPHGSNGLSPHESALGPRRQTYVAPASSPSPGIQ